MHQKNYKGTATARSALCTAISISQDEDSRALLPPALLCNLPGSGPCRPRFSQPAVAGTDWGGPGHQYHRPAPHCSCHRLRAGQHTRTVGSLTSHSDTHDTLGCTWKHKRQDYIQLYYSLSLCEETR